MQKQKILTFLKKMLYLGIFGLEFERIIVIFEISALEFSLLQSLVQKKKSLNLGPKMPDLRYFGLEFENTFFILEFVLFQK